MQVYTRILMLLACVAFGAKVALAQSPLTSYKLSPGDSVTVTVFGQPDLSGDHVVNSTGTIQIPLVGSVFVKETTLEGCGLLISERLEDGFLKKPSVAVRLKEVRPVYVLGEVRAPGSYPFRFGLTALSAVALAGGYGLPDVRPGAILADLLTVEERVNVLTSMRRSLMVRIARLEAERDAKSKFEIPEGVKSTDSRALDAVVQKEQDQLTTNNSAYENTASLLRLQRTRIEKEVTSVQEDLKIQKQRFQVSEERLKTVDNLVSKGLSTGTTLSDLQFRQGQAQGNMYKLEGELARVNEALGGVDLKIWENENTRRARTLNEIREAEARLQETEISLTSAKELLQLRRKQSGKTQTVDETPTIYYGKLVRADATEAVTITINEETVLRPGDILEVRMAQRPAEKAVLGENCVGSDCPKKKYVGSGG